MEEVIGKYHDLESDKVYTVLKRTEETISRPISGVNQTFEGVHNYATSCGHHLEPLDKELKSFKLIDIDGTINKIGD